MSFDLATLGIRVAQAHPAIASPRTTKKQQPNVAAHLPTKRMIQKGRVPSALYATRSGRTLATYSRLSAGDIIRQIKD